jgi:hypothetical protein
MTMVPTAAEPTKTSRREGVLVDMMGKVFVA